MLVANIYMAMEYNHLFLLTLYTSNFFLCKIKKEKTFKKTKKKCGAFFCASPYKVLLILIVFIC
jgi:hypothetical protein